MLPLVALQYVAFSGYVREGKFVGGLQNRQYGRLGGRYAIWLLLSGVRPIWSSDARSELSFSQNLFLNRTRAFYLNIEGELNEERFRIPGSWHGWIVVHPGS